MRDRATIRAADWHECGSEAANTEVVVTRAAADNARHYVTTIEASFDTLNKNGELDMYGLSKVGPMDLTDGDVLDLTNDTFTVAGHGLSDNDQVVFHVLSGSAPTGLTSGNTYFAVNVSGDDFKLEASIGGGAIDISGTQSGFSTEAVILPLCKSWEVFDSFSMQYTHPIRAEYDAPIILKLEAVSGSVGKLNVDGYTI